MCYLMTTFRCPSDILNVFLIQSASFIHLVCGCASLSTTFALSQSGLCTSCERVHFFLVFLDPQTELPACLSNIKEALWIRKTPTCMNRDAGSYQLSRTWDQVISRSRASSSCKQSRRDQDVRVRRTSKRCH